MQVAQKIIMCDGASILICGLMALKPLHPENRRKPRLNVCALTFKGIDQAICMLFSVHGFSVIIKHQIHKLLLSQKRRIPREGQNEIALKHCSKALEKLSSFLIDGCGNTIRKMGQTWFAVAWCIAPYCVHVDRISAAKHPNRLIHAHRGHFFLLVRAARVIVTLIEPGRHKRSVFADDHSVVYYGGIIQKIHEPLIGGPVSFKFVVLVGLAHLKKKHRNQKQTKNTYNQRQTFDNNGLGKNTHHLYSLSLPRKGVERAG